MWSLLNPPKLNGPSTATVDHLTSSEKVHFRIAPMDNFGKLLAPFSAASDPVSVKSSSAKDEVNLVVLGVIAGTTVLAIVVICVVIVYLKRYKNMKKSWVSTKIVLYRENFFISSTNLYMGSVIKVRQ